MKKIIPLILILGLAGFAYWFFQPTQQITRKTKKVLSLYTVNSDSSRAGAAASSLFLESLFADQVEVDISESVSVLLKELNRNSISREHLTIGQQNLSQYVSRLEHTAGKFKVTKIADDHYSVTFPHTIKLIKIIEFPEKQVTTTFTFKKEDDTLKIFKIEIR